MIYNQGQVGSYNSTITNRQHDPSVGVQNHPENVKTDQDNYPSAPPIIPVVHAEYSDNNPNTNINDV